VTELLLVDARDGLFLYTMVSAAWQCQNEEGAAVHKNPATSLAVGVVWVRRKPSGDFLFNTAI
jgi:hypothetical protein